MINWVRFAQNTVVAQSSYHYPCYYPPGKPVAYNHRLLSMPDGLLFGMVAYNFGLLGFPGVSLRLTLSRNCHCLLRKDIREGRKSRTYLRALPTSPDWVWRPGTTWAFAEG